MALKSPPASSEAVRNTMLANRSTDTGPEKAVRRMLREAGRTGYRLHWRIDNADGRYICRPDIAYPGKKVAIFVHGCFWHRCPRCALALPKSNVEYWSGKFERNVERDRMKEAALLNLGWKVHTIWECDIEGGLEQFFTAAGFSGL
mgnify:FL=1|tara:strand:+ start:171 stop:608 length:438 start_codon:yes stop_codon:yes gene_type:complete